MRALQITELTGPDTALKIVDKKMVLPGGTKEALKALPDFKYNT